MPKSGSRRSAFTPRRRREGLVQILANENIGGDVVRLLRAGGHDVAWVLEDSPGALDEDVLSCANAQQRLLITFDKDFGALVFQHGAAASCGIVLFRISLSPPGQAAAKVVATLEGQQRLGLVL